MSGYPGYQNQPGQLNGSSGPAALPPGWTQHWAPNGQPYYFHASSGQSTHVHPLAAPQGNPVSHASFSNATASTSMSAAPAPKPKKEKPKHKDPIPGAPGWLRVTTNLGNIFYTHTETKRSEWTIPDEIVEAVQEMEAAERNASQAADEGQASTPAAPMTVAAEQVDESKAARADQSPSIAPELQSIAAEDRLKADTKRKRSEAPDDQQEDGIDAAQLLATSAQPIESEGSDDEEGGRNQASGAAKRLKPDSESVDADEADDDEVGSENDEEDDEAEWQRKIAAEMAAQDENDVKEQAQRAPPPSAPPQPPLPSQSGPPPGGYSGPPPGFGPPPVTSPPQPQPALSVEEGRALFMHMLTSLNGTPNEVNPMAPWDKELPKFVHLPRYSALGSVKDRQDVFNDWCRTRIREKRAAGTLRRPAAPTTSIAGDEGNKAASPSGGSHQSTSGKSDSAQVYQQLLRENVKSTRTRFDDFRRDFKKDRRFFGFGRDDREREKVFKTYLRELGEEKRRAAEKAESAFLQLLEDKAGTEKEAENRWAGKTDAELKDQVWQGVKRASGLEASKAYVDVGSSTRRAELFVQWARSDARNETTASQAEKEAPSSSNGASSDRAARQAKALQEREEQVRRERHEVERQNRRALHSATQEDSSILFGQWLVDVVRDPTLTWYEVEHELGSRDPRFSVPGLHMGRKRQMTEEHLMRLIEKRRAQIDASLFERFAGKQLDADPDVLLPLIKEDPDYNRLAVKPFVRAMRHQNDSSHRRSVDDVDEDTALRAEWDRWCRVRESKAREEFQEMLKENSFVDFWGRLRREVEQRQSSTANDADSAARSALAQNEAYADDVEDAELPTLLEMSKQVDIEEIHSVLRADARYRAWKHKPELREEWIREYLRSLSGRKMTLWSKEQGEGVSAL
ncbi:unnamed protein product [Jaminaea pallidilutea]